MAKVTKKDQAKIEILKELYAKKNLGFKHTSFIEGLEDVCSHTTINKALKELVDVGLIFHSGTKAKKKYYVVKEDKRTKAGIKEYARLNKGAIKQSLPVINENEKEFLKSQGLTVVEDKDKGASDAPSHNLNFDNVIKATKQYNPFRKQWSTSFKGDKKFVVLFQKDDELTKSLSTFKHGALANRVCDLEKDFEYVVTINADNLDAVFYRMQGEIWSPEGEAHNLIDKLDLSHTSMSAGDVAVDLNSGEIWRVAQEGWIHLNEKKDKKATNKPTHVAPSKKDKKKAAKKKMTRIGSVVMAISKGADTKDLTKLAAAADKVYVEAAKGKSNIKESRTLCGWVMQALVVAKAEELDLSKIEI